MIAGVAKESFEGERRVALVPSSVPALKKAGIDVLVEKGAGQAAGYSDKEYEEKGAQLADGREAVFSGSDAVLQVRGLGANRDAGRSDLELMRAGQLIIGMHDPLGSPESVAELAGRGVAAFSLELMPRISRAQSMDALSSMATIAGYKAALMAAVELHRMFPMLMTAAGTVTPSKVFVVGAGVAGLQAIATAHRLGASVRGYDLRPAVKEQVESVGATFVELDLDTGDSESEGGYAKEMDEAFLEKQREMMKKEVAKSDVVITTALVPGKKAPLLITRDMVSGMRAGSVIVDLAAEQGGNCEATDPGETVDEGGVKVMGPLNIPSTVAYHASMMYSNNITKFVQHLASDGNIDPGGLADDEIGKETLLTRDGKVVNERVAALLSDKDGNKGGES